MKRILLAAALLVTASSAFAEWKLIDSSDKRDLFLDVSRIRMEGSLVKYWILESYKRPQTLNSFLYRSTVYLSEIDCQNENYRIHSGSWFSDAMRKGDLVSAINGPFDWNDVVPNSSTEYFMKKLCPKR